MPIPPSLSSTLALLPVGFFPVPPPTSPVSLSALAANPLFEPPPAIPIDVWKKTVLEPLLKELTLGPAPFMVVHLNSASPLRADPGATPEVVFFVVDGAVEEWQGPLRACTHRAGSVIWSNFALAKSPVRTRTEVRSDAMLLPIRRGSFQAAMSNRPWLMARVMQQMAAQSVDYADDESQLEHAFDRELVGGTGALIPGPFTGDVELFSFFVRGKTAGALQRFEDELPPGVRWRQVGGQRLLPVVVFARFLQADHARVPMGSTPYDELNLFLPVRVQPDVGPAFDALHVARMFPDNGLMVSLGREISGFPKAAAATTYDYLGHPTAGTYRLISQHGDDRLAEVRISHPQRWAAFVPSAPGAVPRAPLVVRVPGAGAIPVPDPTPIIDLLQLLGLPPAPGGQCLGQPLELPTTAWKRIFAPTTQYPDTVKRPVAWEPEHFSVDATVRTPMQLEPMQGELDVVTLVDQAFFRPDVFGDIEVLPMPMTNLRLGVYMRARLTQAASTTEVDYLGPKYASLPRSNPERDKLTWGFR